MANNTSIQFSFVYQQGGNNHPIDPVDYHTLFGPNNQRSVLGGDFNAKNVQWGNLVTNANVAVFAAILNRLLFNMITPDEPTFIGDGRPDFLDLFLVRNVDLHHNITVLHELSSDHLPVILTLGDPADRINDIVISSTTDWEHSQRLLVDTAPIPTVSTIRDLDNAV